jgi:CHRD domain
VRKLTSAAAAAATLALVLAAFAMGSAPKTTVWTASLSAGQEIPKQVVKNANAHGLFKATLRGRTLRWKMTFAALTGSAGAAHIHLGKKGVAGPVILPLCGPCKNGQTGTATVSTAILAAFKAHQLYVNIHTDKNPAGEIRGQLAVG